MRVIVGDEFGNLHCIEDSQNITWTSQIVQRHRRNAITWLSPSCFSDITHECNGTLVGRQSGCIEFCDQQGVFISALCMPSAIRWMTSTSHSAIVLTEAGYASVIAAEAFSPFKAAYDVVDYLSPSLFSPVQTKRRKSVVPSTQSDHVPVPLLPNASFLTPTTPLDICVSNVILPGPIACAAQHSIHPHITGWGGHKTGLKIFDWNQMKLIYEGPDKRQMLTNVSESVEMTAMHFLQSLTCWATGYQDGRLSVHDQTELRKPILEFYAVPPGNRITCFTSISPSATLLPYPSLFVSDNHGQIRTYDLRSTKSPVMTLATQGICSEPELKRRKQLHQQLQPKLGDILSTKSRLTATPRKSLPKLTGTTLDMLILSSESAQSLPKLVAVGADRHATVYTFKLRASQLRPEIEKKMAVEAWNVVLPWKRVIRGWILEKHMPHGSQGLTDNKKERKRSETKEADYSPINHDSYKIGASSVVDRVKVSSD